MALVGRAVLTQRNRQILHCPCRGSGVTSHFCPIELQGLPVFIICMAEPISEDTSVMLLGTISVVLASAATLP